jgi:dihydroxy-acid dehydratase
VIEIDEESRALNLLVEPEVLLVRRRKWEVGEKEDGAAGRKGTSGKYAKLVRDASHGCITDAD